MLRSKNSFGKKLLLRDNEPAKLMSEMTAVQSRRFLRIPPFPGANVRSLVRPRSGPSERLADEEVDQLIGEIRRLRVGGAYWEAPPKAELALASDDGHRPPASDITTDARERFRRDVSDPFDYLDPFTGEPMSIADAVQLCGFWRALIDRNRDIATAVGFAFWKRPTVAPLLWDGGAGPRFASALRDIDTSQPVAVWKARTPPALLAELERSGAKLIEVEDGFIRSAGLGADCVPPLSILVDRLGAHFDPSAPSELEEMLQNDRISPDLLERAARLRQLIVASGISKYGTAASAAKRRTGDQRQILVPGQVEDDRAVLCGGGEVTTNLELLHRVRARNPDAHIIYKPHPDVEAGHRSGIVPDEACLRFADVVMRDQPITTLIDSADEVHVISSLAGFEALLRSTRVTTYGVPFYAGWGLTTDLGAVPGRRTAKRTLDELVAVVLLLYPRYLDPVTGLPCPPEVLIRRIAAGVGHSGDGMVVQLRRLQGRWKKRLARAGLG